MAEVDQKKVYGQNLTLVVIDISKRAGYYTLAAKN